MKRIDQTLIFIFLMVFASTTIAQVTYQVRHDTVASGGVYDITELSSSSVIFDDEPKVMGRKLDPLYEKMSFYLDPAGREVFEPVYIEDTNIPANVTATGDNALLLQKYNVSLTNNIIPPDPTLAVGPNHVIVLTNNSNGIFIYDKNGNLLRNVSSTQFWSGAWPSQEGDPQIIYDHYEGRWVIVFMQIDDAAELAGDLIAYSDDDDPFGTWYTYRLPSTLWGDFPQIGFDHQGIYIATNCWGFSGGFRYAQVKILSKEELYSSNGGQVTFTTLYDITIPGLTQKAWNVRPSFQYSYSDVHYLLWASGGSANFYGFYKIIDPITNPVLTGDPIMVADYYSTPNAVQLGGEEAIESGGSDIKNAPIYRDGYLYAAHSTGNQQGTAANIRYFVVNTLSESILEMAEIGAENYYHIFPSLAVDQDHNIMITCSRSATTEYIGSYYFAKRVTDPPGLSSAYTLQEGLAYYFQDFGYGRNRWGDYLGIYIDPTTEYNFWMVSEYAAALNTYAISVGEVRLMLDIPYLFTRKLNLDFGKIEVGLESDTLSAFIANYGSQDLIITDIPDSSSAFYLVSSHTFPITLSNLDSVEIKFQFRPTNAGQYSNLYPVQNNSSNFTGFNLKGYGFNIFPAEFNEFYAMTGSINGGNLISIDPLSGAGTIIGPSSFTDILGLNINPKNGVLYGFRTNAVGSEIVRISSVEGDAYSYLPVNLPNLFSIAFDSSGQLYATNSSNQIYSIDLNDGSYALVSTMPVSRVAFTFNQLNNELWGSIRAYTGVKDAVVKIDLNSGDTTFIGQTGFGVNTNDLAFDKNGSLFGIKGGFTLNNDFYSIDLATGVGTLIGSIGIPDVKALGYIPDGITSVEDSKEILPKSFTLEQNFPNPFNPATTINFSLPTSADVKLTVYNLLGETVRVLVDNQMSAGNHSVVWNADGNSGRKMSSGIYFYELKASSDNGKNFNQIRKMILIK